MARRLLISKAMAYLPRCEIVYDGAYFHVTWRCHNKDWLMRWDWAKEAYYYLLLKYKDRYGIEIHAYSLMDNHPHIVGKLTTVKQFSQFFQLVNSRFARVVNAHFGRRGQVVMDRFKSPVIESDRHMLTAMAYVDLNQHRAGKVDHPKENAWSSYAYYAYGRPDPLVTPSPSYLALGDSPKERQLAYRAIVEGLMINGQVLNISHTYFIGDPEWVIGKYRELCARLGIKAVEKRVLRMLSPPQPNRPTP